MKLKAVILFVFFSSAFLLWSDTVLEYFTAKSSGNTVNIEWKSTDESSIVRYELERGTADKYFTKIESFDAKGGGMVYRHTDDNVYMKGPNGGEDKSMQSATYKYRLKIIKSQNTYTYSNTVDIVMNINVIHRTWGMIKEMFR